MSARPRTAPLWRAARRALPALVLLLLAAEAGARLGGGQSYSGGGGSYSGGGGGYSGGGGGGGGGDLIFLLVRLCIHYPALGFPVVIGLIVFFCMSQDAQGGVRFHSVHVGSAGRPGGAPSFPPPRHAYPDLAILDPNFSRVVFVDFVHSLFTRFHAARGHRVFDPLAPYLGPALLHQAKDDDRDRISSLPKVDAVDEIVIGSLTPIQVRVRGGEQEVVVRIKANYAEVRGETRRPLYTEQSWVLVRPEGTLSPTPEQARTLGCPSCGAPVELTPQGTCTYCDQPVVRETKSWRLKSITVLRTEARRDMTFSGGGVVEEGTNLPSRVDPDLDAQRRKLQDRHPDFSFPAFRERVKAMFLTLQAGWSAQDASKMRPYETDLLFESHRFWMERYREQGARNVLEDVVVEDMLVVRVDVDAYYEAVVVRIFSSMKDYTVDGQGNVVEGSRDTPRRFSEYWTLARSATAAQREERPPGSCPSCGAPLDDVNQAGVCGYCDAKVVTGEFGWVLTLIEQDEEYAG